MLNNLGGAEQEQEVAFVSKLTPVEEKDREKLFHQNALSKYLSEISSNKFLTKEEEEGLSHKIFGKVDFNAREILIVRNLRLVPWVARRFLWSKVPFEDLIQEGNIGLMTAVEKFDSRIGRFSTYAVWWIESGIRRAIMDHSETIRSPVHIQELRSKIESTRKELVKRGIPRPTHLLIAQQIGVEEEVVKDALWTQLQCFSLDQEVQDEENGSTLENFISEKQVALPENAVEAEEELIKFSGLLNLLCNQILSLPKVSERDFLIFKCFYGFNETTEKMTLQEVGDIFGVSRERVRQIIEQIWIKMRQFHPDTIEDNMKMYIHCIGELEKITGILVKFN